MSKASDGIRRDHLLFAQSASVISVAVGTVVLVGWGFDIFMFKSVLPGLATMKPNTAICFILLGIALWLSHNQKTQSESVVLKRRRIAQACAFFSAFIGSITLSEHLLGINVGIDELLFGRALLATKLPFPGRMAHVTALEFVIFGIALLLLNAESRRGQRLSQILALIGTVIGLIALVGYAYGAETLYRVSAFSSVALHTAVLFTLLGFAILCARPDFGLMSTVTDANLGGSLARRILPLALTFPFLIGWLRLQGQHAGLYGTEFGLAIFTISNVLIFAALVWLGSKSLNKADAERQRAAAGLQGANEQLSEQTRVLDLAQVLVRDMESRIVRWNLGAERLYGFSKQEALGRVSHELLNTLFPEPLAQIEDTLHRCGKWEGELVHRKRDNGRLVVASQWVLHPDSAGCPVRIIETNTDITERKKVEQVIQESEERFRTMANSIPQLAWIAHADGYIFWYNQRWYEYTGTTPEQMEGWGWQSVHDPLVLHKVLEQWRASIATGQSFDMVLPLLGADGLFRPFLTRMFPLKDSEGRVVQWFGTNTDISEHKRAEEQIRQLNADLERRVIERTAQLQAANFKLNTEIVERKRTEEVLRQSEERFRQLVDGVQDYAIFMLDPQGHVASWNKGAERIKGYKADEIIGHHFSCFYPPEATTQGKPERQLQTAVEQGHVEDEGWRVSKNGQQFWANVVITAVFDNNSCLQGFSKITRDMTERKRLEEILRYKNIELQNAAETKDKFLANMSHELRTPLNGIIGFGEFLVDAKPGPINAKQEEYLEDILNSSRLLLQLINDILDLAKVGAGKMELNPERFSLRKAIEEACAVAKPIAQKKNIHIEVKIAPEIDYVTLDQRKFKQVVYNLLSNAIKFNHDGGKVEIRAEPHDTDSVKLVVSDTGVGIKTEDIGRLFREFEQLESGTSRHYEGTGLGLALTRKIVELQGGTIGLESEVGKGSSFKVVLPLGAASLACIGS